MASILNTPCDAFLPDALKPMFTSHTFIPHPQSIPIPLYAAITPPLTYFLASFCLSANHDSAINNVTKYILATISAITFALLPFQYYVPGSAIFTYQLGLIGCFGCARVLDIFFLSRPRKPQRITIPQPEYGTGKVRKPEFGHEDTTVDDWNGPVYPDSDNLKWKTDPQPQTIPSRLWYAFDLMISMRGSGWDFASADLRHDVSPWQPPSSRQIRMAFLKILPALVAAVLITRNMLGRLLQKEQSSTSATIVDLPPHLRPLLVLATGGSLYTLFDAGYTIVSAGLLPVLKAIGKVTEGNLHNVDFFPLLNPLKLTEIRSVRSFWSKAWHRLFHRAFLVFGILPFQNLALLLFPRPNAKLLSPRSHPDPGRLLPKGTHDWAKVLGAFFASGAVHAISERAALGGRISLPPNNLWLQYGWASDVQDVRLDLPSTAGLASSSASSGRWSVSRIVPPISGGGEFTFFMLNGVAVLIEGAVSAYVFKLRKQALVSKRTLADQLAPPTSEEVRVSGVDTPSTPMTRSRSSNGSAVTSRRHGLDAVKDGSNMQRTGTPPPAPQDHAVAPTPPAPQVSSEDLSRSYDRYVGLIWTVIVLLWTGEAFVEGWIKSGLLAEFSMMPH
ncbi:unnamed protein product [Sympodiomycopsis kandeliae]